MVITQRQTAGIDRRQCPDVIVKSTRWVITTCWLIIAIVCLCLYFAMPERPTIQMSISISREARSYWDMSMLKNVFIMMVVLLLISLFGLAESILRHNRVVDNIPKTLILTVIMSLVGMFVIYSYF
ncbi:MAG: hypothetical protein H7843_08690 [Nitrospirota bacterium]